MVLSKIVEKSNQDEQTQDMEEIETVIGIQIFMEIS
jgi:hypothetical protein